MYICLLVLQPTVVDRESDGPVVSFSNWVDLFLNYCIMNFVSFRLYTFFCFVNIVVRVFLGRTVGSIIVLWLIKLGLVLNSWVTIMSGK